MRARTRRSEAFIAELNGTEVLPDVLAEVVEMQANLPSEDRRAMEIRLIRTFQLLTEKGFNRQQVTDLAMAINFRLTALADLLASQAVRGWSMPGEEPGQEYIHPDVVVAAAKEPLIETPERQAGFEPESFRKRVLTLAEVDGHA